MSNTEDEADEITETEIYSDQTESVSLGFRYEIGEGGYEYGDRGSEMDSGMQEDLDWVRKLVTSGWGDAEEEEGFRRIAIEKEESIDDTNLVPSKPRISDGGTLNLDLLEFDYCYGFNSGKFFNVVILEPTIFVFISGNYLQFLNIETHEIWFRRSILGGGIGSIKKNIYFNHLAVAECGRNPIIILYEWPTMEIFGVLRDGTTRSYSSLDYTKDGLLLVSQGGEPDYNITVWNWPKKRILLRTKSYVNDVFKVKFNFHNAGQLVTAGVSHIKFWKMAHTFTGLKLKGEVGRFGKTEYSDIVGVTLMPDGKILSGCEWGNILVWDDGLIKLEVMRTQRKPCHDKPIVLLTYNESEMWSASMDGHIKMWWYEKIDQADPPDEDRVVMIEPTYDFETPGVMIMSVERKDVSLWSSTDFIVQDGNGGIWQIDLNPEGEPRAPIQLFNCHGGRITDMVACPYDHYLVTVGSEGKLILYDYTQQKQVFVHKFPAACSCVVWLPVEMHPCGDELIVGFDDGQLRVCLLSLDRHNFNLKVVQIIKPHNKPVNLIDLNKKSHILVSSGEDSTIFIFKLEPQDELISLVPIGFIPTPDIVTCITWDPRHPNEVLVGCLHGHMMQSVLPTTPQDYTTISYLLDLKPRTNRFTSYKAQIRRDIRIKEIEAKKAVKLEKKRKELEKLKRENPGMAIDEEVFLVDSDSEEELEPLHIPEVPNKILWLKYTEYHTIWLSMAGYDAGYIYEYYIDQMDHKPIKFKMVHDADDVEISSYLYSHKQQFLIFGMQDGSIRINKVNHFDCTDLSNYWTFPMHDNLNGFIPKMAFSWDEEYFFSVGHDCCLFAYKFNPKDYERIKLYYIILPNKRTIDIPDVADSPGYSHLSLEEAMLKAEQDRINRVANLHKAKTRKMIHKMQTMYEFILDQNHTLLPSQIFKPEDLEIDPRITEYIQKNFEGRLALVKRKLAYDVEKSRVRLEKLKEFFINRLDFYPIIVHGIKANVQVSSIRQFKLPLDLEEVKKQIEVKLIEEASRGRPAARPSATTKLSETYREETHETEYFLLSLSENTIHNKLGPRLTRLLDNYRKRIRKWKQRILEWEVLNSKRPRPNVNHPDDVAAYEIAKSSIGNYVLKTDDDYSVPHEQKETTTKKYKQVIQFREELFELNHIFSQRIYDLRTEKYKVIQDIVKLEEELEDLKKEIPEDMVTESSPILRYNPKDWDDLKFDVVVGEADGAASVRSDEDDDDFSDVFIPELTWSQIEMELLPKRPGFPLRHPSGKYFDVSDILDRLRHIKKAGFQHLCSTGKNESVDTDFERELRVWRLNRLLYEQSLAIHKKNNLIKKFDGKLGKIQRERMKVLFDGSIKELHILALSQELMVLSKFESNESYLENQVLNNNHALLDMKDVIASMKHKIADVQASNEENSTKMEQIYEKFSQVANNNKFYDFLRKVFKKKYKIRRVRTEDDSSSDSSSSSSDDSDEDDAASIDSRDFAVIKLDLNVCPKGCEQAIYDYTISLRSKRYEIEFAIKENERKIELFKKELEINNKQFHQLENILAESKRELVEYQREKQRALNQIICTLVLKLEQIQIYAENRYFNVEDSVIIDRSILKHLYDRVGQLRQENLKEKQKREVYIRHLLRMKRDFKYMSATIKKVQNEICYYMFIKFGRIVDVNEVEMNVLKSQLKAEITDMAEVRLKQMIYELRIKAVNIKAQFSGRINRSKQNITQLQEKYLSLMKANTARNELLRILKQKAESFEKEVSAQDSQLSKYDYFKAKITEDKNELVKIKNIIEAQKIEIQDLKDEITMLKTKGYPPKPVRERKSPVLVEEEEEEEKVSYADYVGVEESFEEKLLAEIILPIGEELGEDLREDVRPEEIVKGMLSEIFGHVEGELERISVENMVKDILERVLKCGSCHEIVKELIDSLPLEPSETQLEIIEESAEKLFELQVVSVETSSEAEEDQLEYFQMILEDIIDDTLMEKGEVEEVVKRMLLQVLDQVPLKYLLRKQCIEKLAHRLAPKISDESIRKEILPELEDLAEFHKEDVRTIISALLVKMTTSTEIIAREVIEDIVDNIMEEKGETHKVIAHIVEDIVKKVPVQNLLVEENFDIVIDLIKEKFERKLDMGSLLEGVSSIDLMLITDVRKILNIILHNVYDTGLDYIYVINTEHKDYEQ